MSFSRCEPLLTLVLLVHCSWVERLRLVGLQRQEAYITSEPASSVQISAVRSANGMSSSNGIRKRDDDGVDSFRHRKNSRKVNGSSSVDMEEESEL